MLDEDQALPVENQRRYLLKKQLATGQATSWALASINWRLTLDLLDAYVLDHLRDHLSVVPDTDVKHQNLKWPTTIIHIIKGKALPGPSPITLAV